MFRTSSRWLLVVAFGVIGGCTAIAGLGGYEKGDCVGLACGAETDGDPREIGAEIGTDGGDAGRDSTLDTARDSTLDSAVDSANVDGADSTADSAPADSTLDSGLDSAVDDGGALDGFVGCDASPPSPTAGGCPPDMIEFPAADYPSPHGTVGGFHHVDRFCIDRFEVDGARFQAIWAACGGDPAVVTGTCMSATYGDPSRPMNCVSGVESERAYCNRVGKRLPTDGEWEFVERNAPTPGDAGSQYPWGANVLDAMDDVHLCWRNATTGPCVAHSFPAGDGLRGSGVVDLAGNVEEWATTTIEDGGFLVRGGSWTTVDPTGVSADDGRGVTPGTERSNDRGFRCVKPLLP